MKRLKLFENFYDYSLLRAALESNIQKVLKAMEESLGSISAKYRTTERSFVDDIRKASEEVDGQETPCLIGRTHYFYLLSDSDVKEKEMGSSNEIVIPIGDNKNIVVVAV